MQRCVLSIVLCSIQSQASYGGRKGFRHAVRSPGMKPEALPKHANVTGNWRIDKIHHDRPEDRDGHRQAEASVDQRKQVETRGDKQT